VEVEAASHSTQPVKRRHFYGRRIGRGMTAFQHGLLETLLPELTLDLSASPPQPLTALFGPDIREVWLEIGFGGGEHLAWQAERHRDVGFIGCEPFVKGVANLVRSARQGGLAPLRIHNDDARFALDWLPDASIGRVFVLFPDPWPKKRHRKRRFLGTDALASFARVMKRGAVLRFATDIADYAEMVNENMASQPAFAAKPGLLAERPADWPQTRYEQKAIAAGRLCQFFAFERL
jgi:tRNA (guanine-N7-)-methyltransferase